MIDLRCPDRTTVCVGTPARRYFIWPTGATPVLCDPCMAELRSMGTDVREERRESTRRELAGVGR